jgi:hypothetical protein
MNNVKVLAGLIGDSLAFQATLRLLLTLSSVDYIMNID